MVICMYVDLLNQRTVIYANSSYHGDFFLSIGDSAVDISQTLYIEETNSQDRL